ncbi:MAG: response regulator [Anaerolineales bacterium]|nr:response regulator [Anaerolineales bacterium]
MKTTDNVAKLIRFQVTRHIPSGLLVELEDGSNGMIRIRELSWDPEERLNWQSLFPVGWQAQAVLTGEGSEDRKELSLRLAENDPWDTIPGRFRKGQVVEGIVTGVVAYGAFVEFASGITGLLHHSEFPSWVKKGPLDAFWPGDHVRVSIQQIDLVKRRVSLGLAMTTSAPSLSGFPSDGGIKSTVITQPDTYHSALSDTLDQFQSKNYPKRHFLIVEDEPDQSHAIANWLKRLEQRVDTAASAEAALELLEKTKPDLALIDVGLPGMNGIELGRIMLELSPQVRLIITTDWARADEHWKEMEELQGQGVELLVKPLLPEDLLDILQRSRKRLARTEEQVSLRSSFDYAPLTTLSHERPTQNLLSECREATGFEIAILFNLDPMHRQVQILQSAGGFEPSRNAALGSLIYSPVRDIAEDGDIVQLEQYTLEHHGRFRYLLEFFPEMAACLGVPVSSGRQSQYALVLLDRRARHITPEVVLFTKATALAISALLEQKAFREQALVIQRTALMGHITSAMVHEVNNMLSRLNDRLRGLSNHLSNADEPDTTPTKYKGHLKVIRAEIGEAYRDLRAIAKSMTMFGRIIIKDQTEVLRVDEIISQVVEIMRETGKRYRVSISVDMPETLMLIRGQAAALEHILMNLILNAIQQITETGRAEGGWVQIRIESQREASTPKRLTILVEDNGPGIHTSLWERIFEAGFTTRADGSGLGLYICRSLVDAMGGQIRVKKSLVLGGSIFAVDLPSRF